MQFGPRQFSRQLDRGRKEHWSILEIATNELTVMKGKFTQYFCYCDWFRPSRDSGNGLTQRKSRAEGIVSMRSSSVASSIIASFLLPAEGKKNEEVYLVCVFVIRVGSWFVLRFALLQHETQTREGSGLVFGFQHEAFLLT